MNGRHGWKREREAEAGTSSHPTVTVPRDDKTRDQKLCCLGAHVERMMKRERRRQQSYLYESREGAYKNLAGTLRTHKPRSDKKDVLASAVGKLQNTFIPFTTNKKILRRSFFRAHIIRMHQGKGPGNLELKASASAEERGDIPGSTLTFFQRCAGEGGHTGN